MQDLSVSLISPCSLPCPKASPLAARDASRLRVHEPAPDWASPVMATRSGKEAGLQINVPIKKGDTGI